MTGEKGVNPPVVANKLKKLYNSNIQNVELYPGLMAERTKPADKIGSALALPFTISRAILSDAVNLVRNDRFYTDDLNQHNIAYWDWDHLKVDTDKLATGGIIHQLILKHLPGCYKNNSASALYPFTIREKTKKNLGQRVTGIDFNKPNV
jgi:linoleate 8R-lipoxygenase / 9,12-octadecadienoate 8-hydroperoxide 8R-isomerase